jgi:lysozyme
MRHFGFAICLLAGLAVSGCTSTSVMGSVSSSRISNETTSSIVPAPMPRAAIGQNPTASTGQTAQAPTQSPPATEVAYAAAYPGAASFPMPQVHSPRFSDAKPVDFGNRAPDRYAVHGVDVSHWQGEIDWATLRQRGANFAFIKATEGGLHLDPRFKENWDGAAAAGIKRGAYHFYFWCRPAREQAEWFIRNVPRVANALPPVLDVEWTNSRKCPRRPSPATVVSEMKIFLEMLERHYGQRPIIYVTVDFYRDNLRGQLKDYPFWLRSVAAHPEKVYPGRDWVFWQYSGTGLSKGVREKIDLNVFNGSKADWHNWLARSVLTGA